MNLISFYIIESIFRGDAELPESSIAAVPVFVPAHVLGVVFLSFGNCEDWTIMELNECINFELNSVQNAVFNYFKAKLTPYDVTPIQYALLKCLWTEDLQTPTQLAQTLHLDTSSVTGLLARLEKKELIERIYSQQDRRSIQVHLLENGAALQKPIEAAILEANQEITRGISPEDYHLFQDLLKVMENNAKAK